jgi:alpha-amylase
MKFLIMWLAILCVPLYTWAETPNGLVYHMLVRSFADGKSDPQGNGDLQGVIDKLAYLNDGNPTTDNDLEIQVLWLMPVFPSPTYHGYDVTDFKAIHPDYGTLGDLDALLAAAHSRHVSIILDLPLNHTSTEHEYFKKALADPASPYRQYYTFKANPGSCGKGWHKAPATAEDLCYLGVFDPGMPDLNYNNPAVKDEAKQIAKFWLDRHVDGFRLDAAKHIYGDGLDGTDQDHLDNNSWWLEFSNYVYGINKEAILIGEVLGNSDILHHYSWGLDGLVDEPFMASVRDYLRSPSRDFVLHHKTFVENARTINRTAYDPTSPFPDVPFNSYPYVASHDKNPRLASDIEKMQAEGKVQNLNGAYRVAIYLLLTVASHPILYSGDEVMQRGWKWNGNPPNHPKAPGDGSNIFDETLREPFPWYTNGSGAKQTKWFDSRYDKPNDGVSVEEQAATGGMLHLIRGLTNLRTKHEVLREGDIGAILSDNVQWAVFERVKGGVHYLILINTTSTGMDYHFHQQWFPQYKKSKIVFWSDGGSKTWKDTTNDSLKIESAVFVAPYGLVILKQ